MWDIIGYILKLVSNSNCFLVFSSFIWTSRAYALIPIPHQHMTTSQVRWATALHECGVEQPWAYLLPRYKLPCRFILVWLRSSTLWHRSTLMLLARLHEMFVGMWMWHAGANTLGTGACDPSGRLVTGQLLLCLLSEIFSTCLLHQEIDSCEWVARVGFAQVILYSHSQRTSHAFWFLSGISTMMYRYSVKMRVWFITLKWVCSDYLLVRASYDLELRDSSRLRI